MNQDQINKISNHTNDKVIETLLFIDAANSEAKEWMNSELLEKYGLLETANALVNQEILRTGDTHSLSKMEKQTYDIQNSGLEIIINYLVAQKYMIRLKVSEELFYHPV